MSWYRVVTLSIVIIAMASLPLLSYAATSGEQTIQSEITVGSYTNLTSIGYETISDSGGIISYQNFSEYVSMTVTALNDLGFNATEHVGYLNGTPLPTYNLTFQFNSTNTVNFGYVNTSYSYLNSLHFNTTKTEGTYTFKGVSYPMVKVIALGGTESNASGKNWWFSNQTLEYEPYSGIEFYGTVNTSYIQKNQTFDVNATTTLTATNIYMGPAANGHFNVSFYEEIGIAVTVIVIASVLVFAIRNSRKTPK